MKDVTWYNDQSAKLHYEQMKAAFDPIIANMFPNLELSHVGVHRNEVTEEVIIKLHLNQFGKIRVVSEDNHIKKLTKD